MKATALPRALEVGANLPKELAKPALLAGFAKKVATENSAIANAAIANAAGMANAAGVAKAATENAAIANSAIANAAGMAKAAGLAKVATENSAIANAAGVVKAAATGVGAIGSWGELYAAVVGEATAESVARADFLHYLAGRIGALWIETDSSLPNSPAHLCFYGGCGLGLGDYLLNVVMHCEISGDAVVRAVFLLGYFRYRYKKVVPITKMTVYRLLAVSLLCSAKFADDFPWSNAHVARYAFLSIADLNRIERQFLSMIEYQVFVPDSQLAAFYKALLKTNPTISLCHIQYDMAIKMVTPKCFRDCIPGLEKAVHHRPHQPPVALAPPPPASDRGKSDGGKSDGRPRLGDLLASPPM